jgi:hypothetical protein
MDIITHSMALAKYRINRNMWVSDLYNVGFKLRRAIRRLLPSVSFGVLISLYVTFNDVSAPAPVLDPVKWLERCNI